MKQWLIVLALVAGAEVGVAETLVGDWAYRAIEADGRESGRASIEWIRGEYRLTLGAHEYWGEKLADGTLRFSRAVPGAKGGMVDRLSYDSHPNRAVAEGEMTQAQARQEKNKVRLENAMEVPDKSGIRVIHISTFAGREGGINHVINGTGPATNPNELNLFDGWNLK